ncbi:carbohydrate ABC transporter permease [Falsiroseomonas sp. HW251]|uniref:carbohydrate ABC transporter permease n=1 Tax=Falsiroseomonas sp. HW251 TaxID=3390998 RepID=UPI003D32400E
MNAFVLGRRLGLSLASEVALVLLTLLILLVLVYPTAWVLAASFKTPETMFAASRWEFTLANYVAVMQAGFWRNILNSLVICLGSVLISTVIAANAAYAFSRGRFRGRRALFGSVLFGQTFPWIILVTPVFILFAQLGLLNNWLTMIFVYVAVTLPFSIYLLVGYLRAVPRSLDEAALLDGATPLQIVWRIIFPIMLPGIVATATYGFLLCWSEYLFAVTLLTQEEMKTMPLALYLYFGENVTDWGNVMAASALTTVPTLLLFLPLQTRMVSGLAAGSVKQ